jgi:polysaccharide export outer membrane protein
MKNLKIPVSVMLSMVLMVILNSCAGKKKLKYFTNVPEGGVTEVVKSPTLNVISPNDILYITIFSNDEVSTKILNSAGSPPAGSSAGAPSSGGAAGSEYLVNDSGFIKLAVLGRLKVAGMRKEQIADTIAARLVRIKYVIDPIVIVKLVNFRITVLGEVARPGVITIPNEHVNITEILALAGDMTIYGNRENVLLVREVDGKRIYRRIDLSKIDLFNSDIYNLRNQDIIYIEPTKAKAQTLDRTPMIYSMVLSSLSLIIGLFTLSTR